MAYRLGEISIRIHRRSSRLLSCMIVFGLLIFFLSGCGSTFDHSSSSYSGVSSYSSSEKGALALNLDNNNWAKPSAAMATPSALNAIALPETTDQQVKVMVYFGNTLLVSETWPKGVTSGTVEDIPPGPERRIVVLVTDSNGEILYWGEKTGVTILKDGTTNIGTIETTPFVPEIKYATSTDGEIALKWEPTTGASKYTIYWSTTSPEVSPLSNDGNFSTSDTAFGMDGLQNGTIYFCVVQAENAYGKSPLSSIAIAVPGYDILTSGVANISCKPNEPDHKKTIRLSLDQEIDPSNIAKAVLTLVNKSSSDDYCYYIEGKKLDKTSSTIIDVTDVMKSLQPSDGYDFQVSNSGDSTIYVNDVRLILYYDYHS